MKEIILSLSTGIIVGALFAVIRLPVPAPATVAGLAGIIGLFIGYMVAVHLGFGGK